jgi:hypothetical protein
MSHEVLMANFIPEVVIIRSERLLAEIRFGLDRII